MPSPVNDRAFEVASHCAVVHFIRRARVAQPWHAAQRGRIDAGLAHARREVGCVGLVERECHTGVSSRTQLSTSAIGKPNNPAITRAVTAESGTPSLGKINSAASKIAQAEAT